MTTHAKPMHNRGAQKLYLTLTNGFTSPNRDLPAVTKPTNQPTNQRSAKSKKADITDENLH
jgi:hypothetical protein